MEDSTKKVIVGVVVFFTVLICGLLIFSNLNKKEKVVEENSIKDITFNGLSLDEKYEADTHIIYDAQYEYMDGQVGLSTDKNGIIYYLCFLTTYDEKGNKTNDIKDAKIKYKGNLLTTYEDFVEYFDEGEISNSEISNDKIIKYREDNVYLMLYIRNEELINVELEKVS